MPRNFDLNESAQELLERGYKIVSPEKAEGYKERKLHKEKGFVMMNRDNVNAVKMSLTIGQSGFLMFLIGYMKFNEEGKLFYKGKRLTVNEVSKLVGKSPAQTRKAIGELEAYGLVIREKEGRNVYLNLAQAFFVCGYAEKKVMAVKIFKERLKEVAKELSLNELGLLMFLLGHLHYKAHVLCDNPDEQETSSIVLWKRKDIINELSVSKDFVYKTLNKFLQLKITVEVISVNEGIVLHPSLVCRQTKRPSFDDILEVINESLTKDNYK